MGFEIVESPVRTIWAPVESGETLYVGQLVKAVGDGVGAFGVADGVANCVPRQDAITTMIPFGVVVGTSNRMPVFDSTWKTDSIAAVTTQAQQAARVVTGTVGVEGMFSKADAQSFVQVALIDPCTVLKGRFYNAALGTAPTLLTATTGSTAGLTGTVTNAVEFTPIAEQATIYCRKGANAGIYRITTDTSTTNPVTAVAFPHSIAIGDQFVRVPVRPIGASYAVQLDSTGQYINTGATASADSYAIDVIGLDLREAGNECVYFRFNVYNFLITDRVTTSA